MSEKLNLESQIKKGTLEFNKEALKKLNSMHHQNAGDPEILARIQAFEMAHKLQNSAPELMDLSKEPKHILDFQKIKKFQSF